MAIDSIVLGLFLVLLKLAISLIVAMSAVYLGLWVFDKLTEGINELKELKKGNVAVAILLGAVILSIANVVEGGIASMSGMLAPGLTIAQVIAAGTIGIVNLLLAVILAVFSIYMALWILDKITFGIDEFKELKRGNVAVAIMMAAVLLAVSVVIRSAVASMVSFLSPQSLASALGIG